MKKPEIIDVQGGGSFTFTERVSFCCPCGLTVRVGHDGAGVPLALHAEPRCKPFEDLDLVEYLRWARAAGAQTLN